MTAEAIIAGILNDLITINKDHMIGLKEAFHDMDKDQEKSRELLKAVVELSEDFIEELKEKIHELGAEVTDKTITTGWVYNTWMDIVYNNAGERPEIRKFCDQIAETTMQVYDSVLVKLKDLDKNIFDLVFRQNQELVKSCNELKKEMGNRL